MKIQSLSTLNPQLLRGFRRRRSRCGLLRSLWALVSLRWSALGLVLLLSGCLRVEVEAEQVATLPPGTDGGVVRLYRPDLSICDPAARLDTLDNCGRCGRSCRGTETPGFPAVCCPPREDWGGGCAILNTDNDCSQCGDACTGGRRCVDRVCQ